MSDEKKNSDPGKSNVDSAWKAAESSVDRAWEAAEKQFALLEKARDSGMINEKSYLHRKAQLVNKLTGTEYPEAVTVSERSHQKPELENKPSTQKATATNESFWTLCSTVTSTSGQDTELQIKKYPPPDWSKIKMEKGIKIIWDTNARNWVRERVTVKLDVSRPFSRGGLRAAFHLQDLSNPNVKHVAKWSYDGQDQESKKIYFYDVKAQAIANQLATMFNAHNPPKHCKFINAYVLMLTDRDDSPLCGVEPFISGKYFKYSDNTSWKNDLHRNTPAAFSHYTYEVSQRELLVCDIQGVGDCYTDPQVHSGLRGVRFGIGDRGRQGINEFLSKHVCNDVCRYLELPNVSGLSYLTGHTQPLPDAINPIKGPRKFSGHKNGADLPLLCDGGIKDIDWISNLRSEKIFSNPNQHFCEKYCEIL